MGKRLRYRLPLLGLVIGVIALLAAACGSDPTATSVPPTNTPQPTKAPGETPRPTATTAPVPPTPTSPPQVVKVGTTVPLSGSLATWGDLVNVSMELAFERANRENWAPGFTFELVTEDHQGQAPVGISALRKLATVDKVAVVSTIFTQIALAQVPVADDLEIVLVSSGVQHPEFGKMSQWTFRNASNSAHNADTMYRYLTEVVGLKNPKYAAIYHAGNDAVRILLERDKTLLNALGGEMVAEEAYIPEEKDFRSLLTKLKSANPEVVHLITLGSETALMLNQAAEIGLEPKYFITTTAEGAEVIKVSGQAAEGLIYASPAFNPDDPDPELQDFLSEYKKRLKRDADGFAAAYYDGAKMIVEAVKRAGGASSKEIADGMRSILAFEGIGGDYTFDPATGDGWQSFQIKGVVNQEYKTIVPLIAPYDIP
jgi:branched-chain amino acid transport system substrate-binding protein